ncbi:MAG: CNNM domain-containing protein [Thermoguttaceae bacterium]
MELIELAIMAAMVLLNGVFAGYEIALAAVTVARLQVLARENRRGARAALFMKQNMEASLAATQVAMTLLGASAAAIGGVGAADTIKPFFQATLGLSPLAAEILAIIAVVIPLTFLSILLGELMPKVFSLRNKEWVCLRLSGVMRWFCFSVWPAVWLFETCVMAMMAWSERRWRPRMDPGIKSEAIELLELRAQAASARASRLIGEREEGIILGAARFSSRRVREIMLPAEHISMLDVSASLNACLVTAHLEMHTRFPVVERPRDPESILGYVNFKDLVALMKLSQPHEPSLRSILRPLPSLRDDVLLAACLERLIHEHTHIALVRDAAGKIVGLITLEDVLEELVGEIQDEYDRLPVHAVPSGWAWVVGGGLGLGRLKELTGIDLAADPPEMIAEGGLRTVSDWIIGHSPGHFHSGDIFDRRGVRVVVRKVRRQKVFEAQIGKIGAATRET